MKAGSFRNPYDTCFPAQEFLLIEAVFESNNLDLFTFIINQRGFNSSLSAPGMQRAYETMIRDHEKGAHFLTKLAEKFNLWKILKTPPQLENSNDYIHPLYLAIMSHNVPVTQLLLKAFAERYKQTLKELRQTAGTISFLKKIQNYVYAFFTISILDHGMVLEDNFIKTCDQLFEILNSYTKNSLDVLTTFLSSHPYIIKVSEEEDVDIFRQSALTFSILLRQKEAFYYFCKLSNLDANSLIKHIQPSPLPLEDKQWAISHIKTRYPNSTAQNNKQQHITSLPPNASLPVSAVTFLAPPRAALQPPSPKTELKELRLNCSCCSHLCTIL